MIRAGTTNSDTATRVMYVCHCQGCWNSIQHCVLPVTAKASASSKQQKLRFVCGHCGEYYGYGLLGYDTVLIGRYRLSKGHAGSIFYPKVEGTILFPKVFLHQYMWYKIIKLYIHKQLSIY
jgi:hypothetical protein